MGSSWQSRARPRARERRGRLSLLNVFIHAVHLSLQDFMALQTFS